MTACEEKSAEKNIGDYIIFGRYEQDNDPSNGPEEIRWKILDKQGDELLLISEKCLDAKRYHEGWGDVTWGSCKLQSWLEDEFYHAAFTAEERSIIVNHTVENPDNPDFGTKGGADTLDRIFLLSIQEAGKYFASDEERKTQATPFAQAQGCYTENDGDCWWWLRSPGYGDENAASVYASGAIDTCGVNVVYNNFGVRPALWIRCEK